MSRTRHNFTIKILPRRMISYYEKTIYKYIRYLMVLF